MAKPSTILSSDRSPASSVAVGVLCALGLVQLGTITQSAWQKWRGMSPQPVVSKVIAASPVAETLPSSAPAPAVTASPPPSIVSAAAGLPPLPPLPNANATLPPLPAVPGAAAPAPLPTSAPTVVSSLPALPGGVSAGRVIAAAPPAPVKPAAPPLVPKTGNDQVDELIDVAVQSRDLNDNDGALKVLERADLILPDHPAILRQKALTLSKMGQAVQANKIWDQIAKAGPIAPAAPLAADAPPPPRETPGNLSGAFGGESSGGPLTVGQCTVARDVTNVSGEKVIVKVPVKSTPGVAIDPSKMNLDVFFFDKVDGNRVEATKADPPVYTFDMPVDFATGEEVVTIIYHMPKLTQQEVAEFGQREFYGYVAKLYYQNRLMGSSAAPRDLVGQGDPAANTPNPLLPLPTR